MVMFDVVEEILLRLSSMKDLLRCKSVCKSWYSLILSPSFVNRHLKFVCKNEDKSNKQHQNKRIVVISGSGMSNGCGYTLKIEGSSNGLVCISSIPNGLCLTNPSTGEFRKLQMPPVIPINNLYNCRRYGFGYDSSTNDYKLVMAVHQRGNDHWALVRTFSLKSNIWKLFGRVNYRFKDCEPGILFNGALHWFWFDANYKDRKELIVSFDLAKEEFIEIPQPDDPRYDSSFGSRLGIIEDRLCIFHEPHDGRPRRIWVMRNYNVKPSWELHYDMMDYGVVHYLDMITDFDHRIRKKSAFFWDEKMRPFRDAKYLGFPIFVQTLVSPYSNIEKSSYTKNKNLGVMVKRDNDKVYNLNDAETERKKRKRKVSRNRKKKEKKRLMKSLQKKGRVERRR